MKRKSYRLSEADTFYGLKAGHLREIGIKAYGNDDDTVVYAVGTVKQVTGRHNLENARDNGNPVTLSLFTALQGETDHKLKDPKTGFYTEQAYKIVTI